MKYRTLGRLEWKVSEVGLGTYALGGFWGPTDDNLAREVISEAYKLGITFYDTADLYGEPENRGKVEKLIAEVLVNQGLRSRILIATKGGYDFYASPPKFFQNLDPSYLSMALDRSLERLKVDSVDLYQLHSVPVEEMQKGHVIEFLERAKKDQRIRAAGVSVYNLSGVQEALCHSVIDTVQVIVNMLSDKAELESIMSLCAIHQIGVIAREPLAQSLLTGKYDSSSQFGKNDHRAYKWTKEYLARELPRVEELRCLAREGRTLVQAALKYVLSFAQVSTVIPGARNLQQLRDNAKSSDLPPLTGEELDLIKSV